ncbi:nuclear transport factor 2 family protein [Sphingosinicella sp. BN140058]|uniref:nuclear transport factor 2 family protein n=1 Tax=Sphingosinicella sp. BN140058 TaxID=1892855 RepID=UPI001010556A|nr:nuclear transport factor 2 family protein [Sphingosinicella sp. BN140058]QAY75850.1 nuclear transport factor 2 family protein [Sphingosinicella sp. BN140058]
MSDAGPTTATATEPDYDHLLRSNLQRVFNERDPARRAAAIAELYAEEPVMYEPDAIIHGRAAIADVAGALLTRFGGDFRFVPEGSALGHHGMASLRWQAGTAGTAPTVTGIDTAEIVDGRIARLWVLLAL